MSTWQGGGGGRRAHRGPRGFRVPSGVTSTHTDVQQENCSTDTSLFNTLTLTKHLRVATRTPILQTKIVRMEKIK